MTGHDLRAARRNAGLSMAEAARLTGTPYTTWQGWEAEGTKNARRPPGIAFAWLELYVSFANKETKMDVVKTIDQSRGYKNCLCCVCGQVSQCTPTNDFYSTDDHGDGLVCEKCFRKYVNTKINSC